MIIYLDESKQLAKGKIVLGGFITKINTNTLNKYLKEKIKQYGINDFTELKSTKTNGKFFYDKLLQDSNFDIIQNNIIGVNIDGYFKDNKNDYIKILGLLISNIYDGIKFNNKDIYIFSDNLSFGKDNKKIEKEINEYLNNNYPIYKGYKFIFVNSKSFLGVQLADLIVYQLRLSNITKEKILDDFIRNNNFNIDLTKTYKI